MKLGILGGTTLSKTLGNKYLSTGANVVFGVRQGFETVDVEWKILNMFSDKVFSYKEAIDKSDIILICCENEHLVKVCEALKEVDLTDKLLIDCTNSAYNKYFYCNTTFIQESIGGTPPIYKAFNNLGIDYPKSDVLGMINETYFCGEKGNDKCRVKKLIELIGFKAIDAGEIESALLLEAFYHLKKEITFTKRENTDYHFKLISF
ncbi:NADPH-dependent F420 reductase [Belliella marina]|uniref:NADPH-dependent F420 reductase n=1 Tax=Belliella marina TaxID=1644146 RepID=A0ABW4VG11_9BACT